MLRIALALRQVIPSMAQPEQVAIPILGSGNLPVNRQHDLTGSCEPQTACCIADHQTCIVEVWFFRR